MAIVAAAMDEIMEISSRLGVDPAAIDLDSIVLPQGENMGIVRKIYSQIGVIKEDGLWMPVDGNGRTLGYCFIEFSTPQEAQLAKEKTTGYKLDRSHIFDVNMFVDFEQFMKIPNLWAPPEKEEYKPGENLQHWLTGEKARDQFVILAGSDTRSFVE